MSVSNNLTVSNILRVDKSANIIDLSVNSITLRGETISEWTTSSMWKKDNSNISFSDGKVTIHKELDVSALDVSNTAIIKNLNVTRITISGNTYTDLKNLHSSPYWNENGVLYYNDKDVSIGKKLDVSGLDVSNTATIKKLIIDASDVSYSLLEIHASGKGGDYAGITFHHDDKKYDTVNKNFYANKIQSSWPQGANGTWGKQRIEFITTTDAADIFNDNNGNTKTMGYFEESGLTICGDLYMSTGKINSNSATINNLTVDNKIQATDISGTNIDVSGTMNVHMLDVSNNANVKGKLTVIKDASFHNMVDVSGLDVSNSATINDLIIKNNLTVNEKLTVTKDVSFHNMVDVSGLDVSNSATINDLIIKNNLTVNEKLTVTKDASFHNMVDVSALDVSNSATINDLIIKNNLTVNEKLTVTKDASFHNMVDVSALDVSNSATINDLIIKNNLTVNEKLTVTKDASFHNMVDVSGLDVSNSATINDLIIKNNLTVNEKLTVTKDASFFTIWWMLVHWMFLIVQPLMI